MMYIQTKTFLIIHFDVFLLVLVFGVMYSERLGVAFQRDDTQLMAIFHLFGRKTYNVSFDSVEKFQMLPYIFFAITSLSTHPHSTHFSPSRKMYISLFTITNIYS